MHTSAFTIDVECGISIAMRDYFQVQMPPTERVVSNTRVILQLLEKHRVKATFFILGQVARDYPALVKEIAAGGHETGVHSHDHFQLFRLSEKEAYEDTRTAKDTIEQVTGMPVQGYRAPAFSLLPRTAWALPMLAELGFRYDSSIMPAQTARYGWPGFPEDICTLQLNGGQSLIEFPLSVTNALGRRIPACGGGYLRLFPFWFTQWQFRQVVRRRPVNLYMHPYEVDTVTYPSYFQEAAAKAPLKRRLKLKTLPLNKGTVAGKLDQLLATHPFGRVCDILDQRIRQSPLPVYELASLLPA